MSDIKLTWHGHANFQLFYKEDGKETSIIIDPFFTGNPKAGVKPDAIEKPGIVLVTHMHGDHAGDAASICAKTGALLGIPVGVAGDFLKEGVTEKQICNGHGFNIGGSLKAKGVTITMTQAFHTTDLIAPVGYIMRFPNGYTVYHAGDTGVFAGMGVLGELYSIDLALLPAGSVYTMDIAQAAYAVSLLKAKAVIPMHWGTFPALAQSMEAFPAAVAARSKARCIVMQPGETLAL
ncbi:UPF0173 metal-dependent hydrolase [Deltaproteobacteria bacterium]|nr:UPF0173 metal-dependent hydrolase [Deltaproteobacteria bacterium]